MSEWCAWRRRAHRPCRVADARARAEHLVLHRRARDGRRGTRRCVAVLPWLRRLRALLPEAHGIRDLRARPSGTSSVESGRARAAGGRARANRAGYRLERGRRRARAGVHVPRPGRPTFRDLLRDGAIRPAARARARHAQSAPATHRPRRRRSPSRARQLRVSGRAGLPHLPRGSAGLSIPRDHRARGRRRVRRLAVSDDPGSRDHLPARASGAVRATPPRGVLGRHAGGGPPGRRSVPGSRHLHRGRPGQAHSDPFLLSLRLRARRQSHRSHVGRVPRLRSRSGGDHRLAGRGVSRIACVGARLPAFLRQLRHAPGRCDRARPWPGRTDRPPRESEEER